MAKNKWRKNKILQNYALSYICVFAIPMFLVFSFLYTQSLSALEQKILESEASIVRQMQRAMDGELYRYDSIVSLLDSDVDFQALSQKKSVNISGSDRLGMKRIRLMLSRCNGENASIQSTMISLNNTEYAIQALRALPFEEMYYILSDLPFESKSTNYAGWKKTVSDYSNRNFVKTGETLTYARSLPCYPAGMTDATFFITMSPSYLRDVFYSEEGSGRFLGLIKTNGDMLFSGVEELPISVKLEMLTLDSGNFVMDGRIVTYAKSNWIDGIYFSTVPRELASSSLINYRILSFFLLFLSMVLCAGLTYFFSVRNYNPIKNLLELTSKNADLDGYARIRLALLESMDEKEVIRNREEFDRQLTADSRLLLSLEKNKGCENIISLFPGGYVGSWCAARLSLVDFATNSIDSETGFGTKPPLPICRNVFTAFLQKEFEAAAFYRGDIILFLINTSEQGQLALQKIRLCLECAEQFMRNNYSVESLISLSNCISTPPRSEFCWMIQSLFDQTELIAKISPTGSNRIVLYSKLSEELSLNHDFLLNTIRSLNKAVCANDYKIAYDLSMQLKSQIDYSIANSPAGDVRQEENTEERDLQLKQSLIALINERYQDPNLSVGHLSELLNKNSDFISRSFKRITHIGMLDYIHYVRISAAKKMLTETPGLTVKELSTIVGYNSADSFIRAFKRIEGITPGKFKAGEEESAV